MADIGEMVGRTAMHPLTITGAIIIARVTNDASIGREKAKYEEALKLFRSADRSSDGRRGVFPYDLEVSACRDLVAHVFLRRIILTA
jgi:hypothetical protein